jgi:hypothetical protein
MYHYSWYIDLCVHADGWHCNRLNVSKSEINIVSVQYAVHGCSAGTSFYKFDYLFSCELKYAMATVSACT